MLNLHPAALRSTLEQLEVAIQDHLEWHANLLRVIVCELPGDANDLAAGAHHLCRFGRWYYGLAPPEVRDQPTFVAIGVEHRQAHEIAARILCESAAGRPVSRADFDELVAVSMRLRSELDLFRRELRTALRGRDTLTGALDRDQVLPEMRRWRAVSGDRMEPWCILLVDIDHLEAVNRQYGYPTGDALLVESARSMRELVRPGDKVFRYGGDEFLVTLPRADLPKARDIAAVMREGLSERELFVAGAASVIRVTASIGIAQLEADARIEDSIDHAAQALLLAQAAGGDRSICWDPTVTTGRHWRRLELDEVPRRGGDPAE